MPVARAGLYLRVALLRGLRQLALYYLLLFVIAHGMRFLFVGLDLFRVGEFLVADIALHGVDLLYEV
jgi:hypothetical protein